ncbi:MAG: methylmalonyl-CoA mutase family protein, partial [Halobacteria archaeon]|nr:methylmalonyl-CoA mutase family protein [Halobacteria archaeon]
PLDEVSVSFTINPSAAVIYAMFVALFDKRGIDRSEINATFQNDMLKEFIAQKEWVIPPRPSVDLVVDTVEFAVEQNPKVKPISISGYHIREAGSTAIQELAFTLADGFAYVEACMERGMDVDEFAPQLSFFFNSHNSIFEEIAKFRAARRIWARVMDEKYDAQKPESKRLKFHTQTAGQPLNNVVRTTLQALAAVLGGTQSLHTNSYDEAYALPTQEAVRVALRTQQIIADESGAADVVDPLGGSYFVEALTNETEEKAMEYIEKIEERGDGSILEGVFKGIDQGWFQREIQESAYEYQKRVEEKDEVVVGVNKYVEDEEEDIEILHVDEENARKTQFDRLEQVREERDDSEVEEALENLRDAIENDENTMPYIVEAVKKYATMGEIMQVFQDVHGAYHESRIRV